MIARLMADQIATDLCVTPNARVFGRISGRSRQIDVLIDARHDTNNTRRIVVDAKNRKRKIDVNDVELFRGLMTDVGATHGFLICPTGHTAAAKRRAQSAVSICLVPLNYVQNFDPSTWPECRKSNCKHGRIFWDGYPELSLTLRSMGGAGRNTLKRINFIHYVGKCDRCVSFHVKCLTCGDILLLPDNDDDDVGHQCSCKPPWFWIASIEEDKYQRKSGELRVILKTGKIITVDRRSY